VRVRAAIGRLARGRAEEDRAPAPFVVGFGHSGSTLLRLMLDAHPQLAIPPETNFLPDLIEGWNRGDGPDEVVEFLMGRRRWGDYQLDPEELRRRLAAATPLDPAGAARCFFELYAEQHGKPRWGDKSPRYAITMPLIKRTLPEARFVHLIRDGRDVALSALKGKAPSPERIEQTARRWRRRIGRARSGAERAGSYIEVLYEDLLTDTEAQLRRICELAELPWDDSMLTYHERSEERLKEMAAALPPQDPGRTGGDPERRRERRLRRHALATRPPDPGRLQVWRRKMDPDSLAAFEAIAGDTLTDLGYELGAGAPRS
jgi:hypothetical protein